jgi:cellulose biosynthesis protein BcsQ
MLGSQRFQDFLDRVQQTYDLFVLDTAPDYTRQLANALPVS